VPLRFDERTERMVRVSLLSTSAVLLVGPPGTGKTRLLRRVMEDLLDHHPDFDGLGSPLWRTPEESWTARDVVGGTTVAPGGELRFRPGAVPRALADNRWLVLDEVNRGDADRIFGGLITWLSDQPVEIGQVLEQPQSPVVRLEWDEESLGSGCEREDQLTAEEPSDDVVYRAGRAWRLLGTYNGQDAQRVFRFGQALGRRFQQVPVPAMEPEDFDLVLIEIDAAQGLTVEVTERLSKIYEAHHAADVTRFGPASFFEMRGYLIGALDAAEPTEGRQPGQVAAPGPATVGELLAEAYVVNLGQRLSLLDDPDRAALRARQVEAGAFTEDDWDWLERRIRDFG
jgi:DNA polymerase III delta prime subunit